MQKQLKFCHQFRFTVLPIASYELQTWFLTLSVMGNELVSNDILVNQTEVCGKMLIILDSTSV